MTPTIGIVDYGTGNIASLVMALSDLGARTSLLRCVQDLDRVDAVILPGVGHFGPSASSLSLSGIRKSLLSLASQGLPVLGICLGFQMLTHGSDESPGSHGLALLPGKAIRISPINTHIYKVPHLGWNSLHASSANSRLLHGIPSDDQLFYFANAYGVVVDTQFLTCHAFYQHESSWSGLIEVDSIFGVQFHPEKSRVQGLRLLDNFLTVVKETM